MRPMHSDQKKQAFNQSMHDGHLWDYESFLAGYEAAEEKFFESQENDAAQVEPVRMLTGDDCREHLSRPWLTVEEDAAIAAFCAVNRGKRIPADGEVRNG